MSDKLPTLSPDERSPQAWITYFNEIVHSVWGFDLKSPTIARLRRQMQRVGSDNYGDFVGAIILECLVVSKRQASAIDEAEIIKAIERVQKRIIRSVRQDMPTDLGGAVSAPEIEPEDEISIVIKEFTSFLSQRSLEESLIFQWYYVDGVKNIAEIARRLQISMPTAYRRLKEIQKMYLALREIKQPPNNH